MIETGGKQYRVEPGDIIDVERLPASAQEDSKVIFDRVLLLGSDDDVRIGRPTVEGAQVRGVSVGDVRGPKIVVFKSKRRKGYRRKNGHRQDLLRVRIEDIRTS